MITGHCTNIFDRVLIEFHTISQQGRYTLSIKRSKIYTYSLPTPVDAEDVGSTFSRNVANTVLCHTVQNLQTGLRLIFNYHESLRSVTIKSCIKSINSNIRMSITYDVRTQPTIHTLYKI